MMVFVENINYNGKNIHFYKYGTKEMHLSFVKEGKMI